MTGCVPRLSAAAASVWAKSDGETGDWMPLWRHLDDAAGVAGYLWDRWLPGNIRAIVSECLPAGDSDGRAILEWLAGIHDIGKCSPAFAIQIQSKPRTSWVVDAMRQHGLDMPTELADRSLLRHELAGYLGLESWLDRRFGWSRSQSRSVAVVVGGHHGVPPEPGQLDAGRRKLPHLLGLGLWSAVRDEYLDRAADTLPAGRRLADWKDTPLTVTAQALLTAAVIVADWIASDSERFGYGSCRIEPDRLDIALLSLGLPPAWSASRSDVLTEFAQRFDLPADVEPRPIQRAAVELAIEVATPGLMVVEAPMGEGKTEAALLAAEVLAQRTGAGGVFFALPTQATSNAMFSRVQTWLDHLPSAEPGQRVSMTLVHGKASLNDDYRGLVRQGRMIATGQDATVDRDRIEVEVVAHQWLSGRKKAMLASFVVGTVDQLLFAALKSRHLVLRHLGVAGKVVVIDEVHAYDAYMSTYLDRVLEWLAAYRVPVVMLSATLPARRRMEMVAAYDRGRRTEPAPHARRPWGPPAQFEAPDPYAALGTDIGYPAITCSTGGVPLVQQVQASPRGVQVALSRHSDDLVDLTATLRTALAAGGAALVIRNTVGRVQEAAAHLRRTLPGTEVIVAHSRFVGAHRADRDRLLLQLFGPDGTADRLGKRYVVVASQVAEQSLDVDFDLVVTDVAPVDLVLQRLGRLHRHAGRTRATAVSIPHCHVTGVPDWHDVPPKPERVMGFVYSTYLLYRTLAVITPHLDGRVLSLPGDIAALVQSVYGPAEICPASWMGVVDQAHVKHQSALDERVTKAEVFRLGAPSDSTDLIGWLAAGVGDADDTDQGRAHVRDIDPTIEVIVVRKVDGQIRTLNGLGPASDKAVPVDKPVGWSRARDLAACTLSLPLALSRGSTAVRTEAQLEQNWFPSWQDEPWLKGQLVLALDAGDAAVVGDYRVNYSIENGLEHSRIDDAHPDS